MRKISVKPYRYMRNLSFSLAVLCYDRVSANKEVREVSRKKNEKGRDICKRLCTRDDRESFKMHRVATHFFFAFDASFARLTVSFSGV